MCGSNLVKLAIVHGSLCLVKSTKEISVMLKAQSSFSSLNIKAGPWTASEKKLLDYAEISSQS